jgi:hypothetical protein
VSAAAILLGLVAALRAGLHVQAGLAGSVGYDLLLLMLLLLLIGSVACRQGVAAAAG